MELEGADRNAGFVELGLDSLFLTSIALTLTKKYGAKVTSRQLNEDLSTLNSLAEYFDQQLPAEAASPAPQPAVQQPTMQQPMMQQPMMQQPMMQMPAMPMMQPSQQGGGNNWQWQMAQQMMLMQQQMMMMMTGMAMPQMPQMQPSAPAPSAPAPAPKPAADGGLFVSAEEEKEVKKPFGAVARIEKTQSGQFTSAQQQWLSQFTAAYTAKTAKSKQYTQDHRAHLADPRVVTGFKPHLKELIYQPVS